jgi:hypothetical protein
MVNAKLLPPLKSLIKMVLANISAFYGVGITVQNIFLGLKGPKGYCHLILDKITKPFWNFWNTL